MTDAYECRRCGKRWFYGRVRCPDCGDAATDTVALGVGVLVATTVARVTRPGVREPNPLGVARFGDVSLVAQLADDSLSVGEEVVLDGEYELSDDGDRGPRLERP